MQFLASVHGGPISPRLGLAAPRLRVCESNATRGLACPLRVTFIQREGRRRLHNLDAHLAACNAWQPQGRRHDLVVHCQAHNFRTGLQAAIPLLRQTDVLIGPHGADMTNGLVLHAGATVVELLPPIQRGCPCFMYQKAFAAEKHLLHYTASTQNKSAAVHTGPKSTWRTYNSDFVVPVEVTERVLAKVVDVGGNPRVFRTMDFEY